MLGVGVNATLWFEHTEVDVGAIVTAGVTGVLTVTANEPDCEVQPVFEAVTEIFPLLPMAVMVIWFVPVPVADQLAGSDHA